MLLARSTWHPFLPHLFTAFGHGVARAEQGDEGFGPSLVHLPGALIGLACWVAGMNGYQGGKDPRTHCVFRAGVGRVVGGHSGIAQALCATRTHNFANGKPRAVHGKGAPNVKCLRYFFIASGQAAVAQGNAGKTLWHFSHHAKTNERSPILTKKGDVLDIH